LSPLKFSPEIYMIHRTSAAFSPRLSRAAYFLGGLCLTALIPFALVKPAPAAERVILTYGFAEISTSVESLRNYAERGEVDEALAPYLDFLSEAQRSQLRSVLQARPNIGPVSISQLLYSSIGNTVLRSLGDIIRTPSRRNGAKGLRGALVLAAAEPGGLSLLSVIDKFPSDTVRIDSPRIFQAINGFNGLIKDTQIALAAIEQQATSVNFSTSGDLSTSDLSTSETPLLNLVKSGPYAFTIETLTMADEGRNRTLTVDLYLPEAAAESQVLAPVPLVVISHGATDTRKSFVFIAEHLASHGFAVAALDHPGSDFAHFEALLQGFTDEITDPTEFSDRPRDISFLLDELTKLNDDSNNRLAHRIDLKKIGIIGHSFGGYTALALAGAQLDFDRLKANCDSTEFILNAANTSMLLQCTALAAPEQFSANLRDERIQAVMAMNPVTSSLFGPTGFSHIAIPSLLVAGSADPLAPALLEQIRPFTWLNSTLEQSSAQIESAEITSGPQHYLALIEGGSHLYAVPGLAPPDSALVRRLVSPNIGLTENYLKALSLGFMQMTFAGNTGYPQALTRRAMIDLGAQLSQEALPLYVIDTLTEEMLLPSFNFEPIRYSPSDTIAEPLS
jgi:predicted dienelactone hydrolase